MTRILRQWDEVEIRKLLRLSRKGLTPDQIGMKLGRTGKSVLGKLQRLGAPGYSVPPKRPRTHRHYEFGRCRAKPKPPEPATPRRFSWEEAA